MSNMTHIKTRAIKAGDTATPAAGLAALISDRLKSGQQVLWLVSGGSAVAVAVRTRQLIGRVPLAGQLQVGLADERYGLPGHPHSNFQQLAEAGFDTTGVVMLTVLRGKNMTDSAQDYAAALENSLDKADVKIGLFGMGKDGHTAGLLPGNPIMNETGFAGCYRAPDFERISITPAGIRRLDVAVLYAAGSEKWPALREVFQNSSDVTLPAGILKEVKRLILYTDYKGGMS